MGLSSLLLLGFLGLLLHTQIEVEALREQDIVQTNQPYRTSYHFQPPHNWINDPNGVMYYKGVYHLFYQYDPDGAIFGPIKVWAHAVSYDLINWIHLNHALEPSHPFDIKSCWSGSATFLPGNRPVLMYTGIDIREHQVQNLASPKNLSDPFIREWVKYPKNPVIVAPSGTDPTNFRDPTSAWKGGNGKWTVIVGGQSRNEGLAILFQSEDFLSWVAHPQPFYAENISKSGMIECPDFFPVSVNGTDGVDYTFINDPSVKHVLKISFATNSHDFYYVGKFESEQRKEFNPDNYMLLRFDYGKYYASKTFYDYAKKRRIIWGWVNESDSSDDDVQKGWAGIHAIPRQVWLSKTGKQVMLWPIEELKFLRDQQVSFNRRELIGGSVFEVSGITASQADVEVVFELPELGRGELEEDPTSVDPQLVCSKENESTKGTMGPFGLLVLASKDLTEHTAVYFRIFRGHNRYIGLLCSDQSRSSLRTGIDKTTYGAFFEIDAKQRNISLKSLIDHSVVESFAEEGKVVITSRVYPLIAINKEAHLFLFNNGKLGIEVSKLDAWSMKKARFDHNDVSSDNAV